MFVCYYLGNDFIYGARNNSDLTTAIRFSSGESYYSGCSVSHINDTYNLVRPYRVQTELRDEILSGSMYLLENDGKSSMLGRLRDFQFYGVVPDTNGKLVYKVKDAKFTPEQVFKAIIGEISKAIMENIILSNAFFIIPDYYDQEKRCAIKACLKSVFSNSNIHLVNHSSAVGMRMYEEISHNILCLSLRFDSGPFEVSVLEVTEDGATPLASLSNDNVTGCDMITELLYILEAMVFKDNLKTEYQENSSPEKRVQGRAAYWRVLRKFAYKATSEADLDLSDGNSINPQPEDIKQAFQNLWKELSLTITNCCILAGVDLAKISDVVVTGPFKEHVKFEKLLRELGCSAKITEVNEKDLCKKVVLRGKCIQVLQTAFSVSLNEKSILMVDRFTPYPLKKHSQLIVDVEKPEMTYTLLVYQSRIGDRNRRLVRTFTLKNVTVYQGKISLTILLEIDDNGIVSITVEEMNEKIVLVNAVTL